MNNDAVVYETKFTVEDLKEMIDYMRDEDDEPVELTEWDIDRLGRMIGDMVQAAVQDFIDNLEG